MGREGPVCVKSEGMGKEKVPVRLAIQFVGADEACVGRVRRMGQRVYAGAGQGRRRIWRRTTVLMDGRFAFKQEMGRGSRRGRLSAPSWPRGHADYACSHCRYPCPS